MAVEITIPRLGWSMDEGTFAEWSHPDGAVIAAGDPVFVIESDKALQEVESVDAGRLHILPGGPSPGDIVKVGTVIGFLLAEGEAPPVVSAPVASAAKPPTHVDSAEADRVTLPGEPLAATSGLQSVTAVDRNSAAAGVSAAAGRPMASPSVRRLARQLGVNLQTVAGDGPLSVNDVRAAAAGARPTLPGRPSIPAAVPPRNSDEALPAISPRAARLAIQTGFDWSAVQGSGAAGRIRTRDIEDAVGHEFLPGTIIPISAVRRRTAERLQLSAQHTVPVTLTTTADVTDLMSWRMTQKQKAAGRSVPTIHDFAMCAVAIGLNQYPVLHCRLTAQGLLRPDAAHIGLAVDTSDGLLVPVVHDVASLTLPQVAERTRQLISAARSRRLTAAQLRGSTFTISSLGGFGVDAFTPVIRFPESAILGIGAIRRVPGFDATDRVVARQRMTLSLTFDHRVTDGAPAARFLQIVVDQLENAAYLSFDSLA